MKIQKLLLELSQYGGSIVLYSALSVYCRNQAKASGRIFTDKNSISYVWEPPVRLLPITDEEIADFERWYPLEVELPESLKSPDFLFRKKKRKKKINLLSEERQPDFSKTIYGHCRHGNNMTNCEDCLNMLCESIFSKKK